MDPYQKNSVVINIHNFKLSNRSNCDKTVFTTDFSEFKEAFEIDQVPGMTILVSYTLQMHSLANSVTFS